MPLNGNNPYRSVDLFKDIAIDFKRYAKNKNSPGWPALVAMIFVLLKSPGFWVVATYRFGHWSHWQSISRKKLPISRIFGLYYYLFRYLTIFLVKTDIAPSSCIGPGLHISNRGNIVIGAQRIGANCTIENRVTVGVGRSGLSPHVGDNVHVGSGSIIYGDITVGSNVRIAPHAVVASKIPSNCSVAGNPARVLPQ